MKENVPDYESAWVNLGFAFMCLGEEGKAIGHLEQALKLDPTDHFALNNLATAFYWDKQYERAVNGYRGDPPEPHESQVIHEPGRRA